MAQAQSDAKKGWDKVYSEGFMTMWYPNEDIIRFCSRLIRKRLTHEEYEVKRPVERVLDLGCGNGRHAMYFARQGLKTAGIDVSEKAIEWAGEWARREGLEIDFRVGNIEHLPYEDQSFDAVVSHGVLDHVTMMAARTAAVEVRRVLVQHFFSANETEALFDGLFRILYSEITENRLGPDFQRKYSRWVFATESL
jgi:2-polyprenyl-3-methyl-5-hydroxy-6-metoxy-1,4-benzoquinol methylase